MLPVREGGSDVDVTVAEGVRDVRGGGNRARVGRSVGMLLLALLPPSSGISLDSRRIASRELSLRLSGPTRVLRSIRPPGMLLESMLVKGGGTDMCGGCASFCSDEDDCDEDEDDDEDDDKDCGSGRCTV